MAKVLGIGGVFFRSGDPKGLTQWYNEHLGLPAPAYGTVTLPWRHADDPSREAMTVWSPFPTDTGYFGPTKPAFMINYIVDDLDAMLAALRSDGVAVDDRVEDTEYGRFGWATDPEGNRVELWEPPK